jgi:hypothetical protein
MPTRIDEPSDTTTDDDNVDERTDTAHEVDDLDAFKELLDQVPNSVPVWDDDEFDFD